MRVEVKLEEEEGWQCVNGGVVLAQRPFTLILMMTNL